MIERFLRSHAARLESIYNAMPSPVQDAMTTIRGLGLPRNRHRARTRRYLAELRSNESWTPEQILRFQTKQLKSIVNYARLNSPFYSDYPEFRSSNPDSIRLYPVLKREVVRDNVERMISKAIAQHRIIRAGTTGTTGAALVVAYDDETARRVWALFLRQWIWAGLKIKEPRITFFGSRVVPSQRREPPFWTHNLCEQQVLASSFHLSSRTAPEYLKFLARHRGQVLEAFPSVLGILADFVLERGLTIPMKAVFTSGEPLYPFLRQKAETAFGTRVFDTYGMTELCGIIQECEHGRMHLAPESAYLEILDENDEPVRPGEDGYLTWTGFLNLAMPFIRYRIGDRGNWDTHDSCPCGRNFPIVVPTITRDSDLLHCPDGRIFSPRTLNQTLKQAVSFRFCQFVHDGDNSVLVRAVSSSPQAAKSELDHVCANLRRLLGPEMNVSGSLEVEPIMRAGGKMPLILRQPSPSESI